MVCQPVYLPIERFYQNEVEQLDRMLIGNKLTTISDNKRSRTTCRPNSLTAAQAPS